MANIISHLFEVSKAAGEKPALIIGYGRKSERITYSEFVRGIASRAEALRREGIAIGDHVLLFAPFSIPLFEYMLALFWIGAVAVFVDNWSDRNRLAAAVHVTAPRVFAGSWKTQLLRILSIEIRRIPKKLLIGRTVSVSGSSEPAHVAPDHPALITLTTGSTGKPKAALRTHDFLGEQHEILCRHLGTTPDEVAWTTLPVFVLHFLGTSCTCLLPHRAGGDPDKLDMEEVLEQISAEGVTTIITSPSVLFRLSNAVLASERRTAVTKIFVGGAPVFASDAKRYALAFPSAKIVILYGSTEAEPISGIGLEEFLTLSATAKGLPAGRPIEEIRVQLRPLKGDNSSVGEICVTGRHVLKSYYNSPEEFANNKFEEAGEIWHRTGDAGYFDVNGNLVLMGRVGQRFEFEGSWYYPITVEQILRSIPGVKTGTVIQRANKRVAFLEAEPGTLGIENAVLKALPFSAEIRIVDRLPRDPRHRSKIEYDKLISMLD